MKTNKTNLRKGSTSNVVAFRRNKLAVAVAMASMTFGALQLAQAGVGYGVTSDPGFTAAGNPNYPNYTMPTFYANSELPVVGTVATAADQIVGNALIARTYATDYAPQPNVFVVDSTALPAGLLKNFQYLNQSTSGSSPGPSASNSFNAYILRPTGVANEYSVVFDSGTITVPSVVADTIETIDVSAQNFSVLAGDKIAFYGQGIPVDTTAGSDTLYYPAPTTAPITTNTITLGDAATYPANSSRVYSFAATVTVTTTAGAVTGGLHKFIDELAPLGCATPTSTLQQCIPLAVANTPYQTTPGVDPYPGSDYYEIGIVEYREQMHSDLPMTGTLLRGYVQLVPAGTAGAVQLRELDGITPLTRNVTVNGVTTPQSFWAAAKPHYLGPIIVAGKGKPVRVKYTNLLPVGKSAFTTGPDAKGYNKANGGLRNGDLFIPVDETITGAGLGPNGGVDTFQQNRAELHLHGGLTPWISDGTPHQWTVPLGDSTAVYQTGASFQNVPDMADPGAGSGTLYWTNDQSARLMFYHDHTSGTTRLNVYVGEAAGYVLMDDVENALLNGATVGGTAIAKALPGGVLDQIPLVIQDKTFVPTDIAMQDAKWDTRAWGNTGDLWFPHVYETNQDPASVDGTNPVGRWDWGPWFWPVFGAAFGLPTGEYGDVTTTPEAFMDTMVVNGTVYPKLNVEPKAYRFRVLNAGNDRMLNLGLYVAEPLSIGLAATGSGYTNPTVTIAAATGDTTGGGATADALMGVQSIAITSQTIDPVTNSAGYTVPPTVTIGAPPPGGIQATAVAVLQPGAPGAPTYVKEILVTNPGDGYIAPPTITVTPAPADTTASPITVKASVGLASIKVISPGSGYTKPPVVTISDPTGSGAVAVASVNTEVKMANFTNGFISSTPLSPNGHNTFPVSGGLQGTGWGQADMRVGGVPDPATAGPDIVQYGDEGGILPNPVVIPSTPINYEYNKRSVTVLNVLERGLFLGNAERADIVIDFSQYAGKTLILYNDAPAPVPASDPRIDYYTGNPDMTDSGGAPSTLPGYGPNTRTVMQINVAATATGTVTPFSVATLQSELPKAYKASQDAPVVPAAAYNNAFGTSSKDTFASISTGSAAQPLFSWSDSAGTGAPVGSVTLIGGGTGYKTAPTVTIDPPSCAPLGTLTCAQATGLVATVAGGKVTGINTAGLNGGAGYTSQPKVVFSGGGGLGATAQALLNTTGTKQYPVYNKAIQELFDPVFGRMNATLGVEMPFTGNQNQTTVPLAYIDPQTETIADGETQIWKITHNGVDSHPVHFHLVNVQVINRVGWDGTIKPPYDNEYGWKETVKMNPLEDIIVAVKAKKPVTNGVTGANAFGLPRSTRYLDPSQAPGTALGFSQFDLTGLPINTQTNADGTVVPNTTNPDYNPSFGLAVQPGTVNNVLTDFGDEYVWHCHILGHEENDFMRAFVLNVTNPAPLAPTALAYTGAGALSWTDNATNEYKYLVSRAELNPATLATVGAPVSLGQTGQVAPNLFLPANANTVADAPAAAGLYQYTVTAVAAGNRVGVATTPVADQTAPTTLLTTVGNVSGLVPAAPSNVTFTNVTGTSMTVNWTDNATNETGFLVERSPDGTNWTQLPVTSPVTQPNGAASINIDVASAAGSGTTATKADSGLTLSTTYQYRVSAVNHVGQSAPATGTQATLAYDLRKPSWVATLPVNLVSYNTAGPNTTANDVVQLAFSDNSLNETGYKVEVCFGTNTQCTVATTTSTNVATQNRWYTVPTGQLVYTPPVAPTGSASIQATVALQTGNPANYRFRITPVNGATVGGATTISDISTGMDLRAALPPLTGVAAAANGVGTNSVTVSWTDAANSNTAYRVEWRRQNATGGGFGGWTSTPASSTIPGNASSYVVTGLTASATRAYQFRVTAIGTGQGSATNVGPVQAPNNVTVQ